MKNCLKEVGAFKENKKYENMISRKNYLYKDSNDLRTEFERDYTRILYSTAFRRLKHKTQVFFSPESDHICTRSEHVTYVDSISYTIAKYLGLNEELTRAIATGHDLGHSPFGHAGEKILSEISNRDFGKSFWHERNGLELVDTIELLEDREKNKQNLNLTYAVRDGIISHCGEVDQNGIKPREEFIDLNKEYLKPNQFQPYTWEGCVVKMADKISYIGRDIEDAISLGIIKDDLKELYDILELEKNVKISNNLIINRLIKDICENSNIENGICFSENSANLIDKIKSFNYKKIYGNERMKPAGRYFKIVINEIYDALLQIYDGENTINKLYEYEEVYPNLSKVFREWLTRYYGFEGREKSNLRNRIIFDISKKEDYMKAIIYFISGMTDKYAIDSYNEIIRF